MGESTLTTVKERIISFLSFTVYLLFHNLAASYVSSLCILQVNEIPHIDGNLAVILQMKKTDVFKSPRQERYSRLQFWCRITYIEISGFTKFQVQDWLCGCPSILVQLCLAEPWFEFSPPIIGSTVPTQILAYCS